MINLVTDSAAKTKELAFKLGKLVDAKTLIIMTGDLGAGKTTFTQGLALGMGITKTVTSPTFTIMKIYKNNLPLYHIDAYRLEGVSQDLGLEEMMDDDGVCVIEWPLFIDDRLPKEYINVDLKWLSENERAITISAVGERYMRMLEDLSC